MVKRVPLTPGEKSRFDEKTLKDFVKDIQNKRLPLDRVTVSDDLVTGLRAMVTKDGRITFHASYHFGDQRPLMKIGRLDVSPKDPEYMSVTDARELTKTIKSLADKGIDPQEGLSRRLIRELREHGSAWRPDGKSASKK